MMINGRIFHHKVVIKLIKARNFIDSLLIIDPDKRLTASEASSHTWFKTFHKSDNLVPLIQSAYSARKVLKKAVDAIKALGRMSSVASLSSFKSSTEIDRRESPPSKK
jgi:serine/threonine protein kinase